MFRRKRYLTNVKTPSTNALPNPPKLADLRQNRKLQTHSIKDKPTKSIGIKKEYALPEDITPTELTASNLLENWKKIADAIKKERDGLSAIMRNYIPTYIDTNLIELRVTDQFCLNQLEAQREYLHRIFIEGLALPKDFQIRFVLDPNAPTAKIQRCDMTEEALYADIKKQNQALKLWLEEYGI